MILPFDLARRRGAELGGTVRGQHRLRQPGTERTLRLAADTLAGLGYEPRRETDRVALANCPFHTLARQQTELVCGLAHRARRRVPQFSAGADQAR